MNQLTLIKDLGIYIKEGTKDRRRYGLYKCECGNEVIASKQRVDSNNTKSCGCYKLKKLLDRSTTHGLSKNGLYLTWFNMIRRCYNEKCAEFKTYGKRGIVVCNEWKDLKTFVLWSEINGYKKGLQIDRIDNNGNYSPENCQFITHAENNVSWKKRTPSNNTSGYVGIVFHKRINRWESIIRIDKKTKCLGYFKFIDDAVVARINKEVEVYGEQKTNLNFKKGV